MVREIGMQAGGDQVPVSVISRGPSGIHRQHDFLGLQRGISSDFLQALSFQDAFAFIEAENFHSRFPDSGSSLNHQALQLKMIDPANSAWIKETCELSGRWRQGTDVRPCGSIAEGASVCQIVRYR